LIIHVVKTWRELFSISRTYGISAEKIAKDNELKDPRQLVIGQSLVILEGEESIQ
jgi:spore germination protein